MAVVGTNHCDSIYIYNCDGFVQSLSWHNRHSQSLQHQALTDNHNIISSPAGNHENIGCRIYFLQFTRLILKRIFLANWTLKQVLGSLNSSSKIGCIYTYEGRNTNVWLKATLTETIGYLIIKGASKKPVKFKKYM